MSEQPQAPRPSLAPDLPPAPREEQLPAPPPAAQLTPSGRPLNVPTVVQVLDRIGDMLGCVILGLLCNAGKIGGTETLIAIGAILGVGTGLRQIGARAGAGAGVGVIGLMLLGGARWLAPAAGAAELARASGVFGALCLALVFGGAGCSSGATGAAAALKTATTILDASREVRRYLCHRALDPLLGDPRATPAESSGSTAPPNAPPPAPPPEVPAPALPPIPVTVPAADAGGVASTDGGTP